MPATAEGNRKIAAKLKEKYGTDAQGRSVFHATVGSKGGENSPGGYFKVLQETDPERLKQIASLGGKAKKEGENARQDTYQ